MDKAWIVGENIQSKKSTILNNHKNLTLYPHKTSLSKEMSGKCRG
jgi:hypothetical protein